MSENKEDKTSKYITLVIVAILFCFTAILVAFVASGHPDLAFSVLRGIGMGVGALCLLLLLIAIIG